MTCMFCGRQATHEIRKSPCCERCWQKLRHILEDEDEEEQEAVEPEVETLNEIDRIYRCPKCHKHFFYEKQKYCDQCGRKVKWNE